MQFVFEIQDLQKRCLRYVRRRNAVFYAGHAPL